MFSCINQVKNDWRNRLSRERLQHNLRIGEDSPTNKDFDSETSISRWNNEKVSESCYRETAQLFREGNTSTSVDVVKYCM